MSGPSTRTLYRVTPWPAGGPSTAPVVTSNTAPCQGQVTSTPSTAPSHSGPPTCVQVLSMAWNEPPTLKSAISLPLTSTIVAWPAGISSILATFTNSGIASPNRPGLTVRSLSTARGSPQASNSVSLLASKLSQEPAHRIVEVIHHSLFQRNDCVVGDVDVFGANFRAAFGYVAESDAEFVFQQPGAIQTVKRMHFQAGDAHEEARAAELLNFLVIAQHMADVLAKEAFNALAKLLHAIDFVLIHLPFDVRPRGKWRDCFVDAVIPRDVGNKILEHREALHRLYRDRFVQRQSVETRFAG